MASGTAKGKKESLAMRFVYSRGLLHAAGVGKVIPGFGALKAAAY